MRIGILTGGGDCPGLNAAIRAVVKRGTSEHGCSIVGFRNGWQGVIDGDAQPLTRDDVSGILVVGGTMLGTARCHPHKVEGGMEAVRDTVVNEKLDGLICIGGDGTLKAAGKVVGGDRSSSYRHSQDDRQRCGGHRRGDRLRHRGHALRPRRSTACTPLLSRTTA